MEESVLRASASTAQQLERIIWLSVTQYCGTEVLGVGDVTNFIHLGRDDTEVHRQPLAHEAVDPLRTHQDNDGVLRAHGPVVLLPIVVSSPQAR